MRIAQETAPAVETAQDEKHVTINQDDQTGEEKKKWHWAGVPVWVLKRHLYSRASGLARQVYDAILVKASFYTGVAQFDSWDELAANAGIARGHVCRGVTELIAKYMITKGTSNTFKLVRTETDADDLVRERPATIHQAKHQKFLQSHRRAGARLTQARRRAPSPGAQARACPGAQARAPGKPHTLKLLDSLLDQQQLDKTNSRTNVSAPPTAAAAVDEGVEIAKILMASQVDLRDEEMALIDDLDYLRLLIDNADELDRRHELNFGKGRYIASGLRAKRKGKSYEPLPGARRETFKRLNADKARSIDKDRKIEARKEAAERAELEKQVRAWLDENDDETLARFKRELLEQRGEFYGDFMRGKDPRKSYPLACDLYNVFVRGLATPADSGPSPAPRRSRQDSTAALSALLLGACPGGVR